MLRKLVAIILIAMVALMPLSVGAAKPDPENMPLMQDCATAEQQAAIYRGTEPFCLYEGRDTFLVPIRPGFTTDWYFQMQIYNTSFEPTEICDNDGYLGIHWWRAYRDQNSPHPNFMGQEYVRDNCVPGTYILEIRWEERDPLTGQVSYYETHFRRWVIPEEGK